MKNLFIFSLFFLALNSAHAGTYNFYFNNTEQGDNSTASPSVIVKDENGNVVDPAQAGLAPATSANPTPPPPAQEPPLPATAGTTVMDRMMNAEFPIPEWRLAIGSIKNSQSMLGNGRVSGRYQNSLLGTQGSLFYFPQRKLGLGFQAGRFLGPEVEYNPFGIRQGFGRVNFGITAALFSDIRNNFEKNIYIGGQASLNIIKDLGLGFSLRFTPYERNNAVYALANWNLHLLF